jgi:CBS domain-containing protein
MDVSTLLTRKGHSVATASATDSVAEALSLMAEQNIGALVITDQGQIIGILSERDIVRRLADDTKTRERKVSELMSPLVTTCPPDTSCGQLMALMTSERIRHVPVVQDGDLIGLVSIGDVVKAYVEEIEKDRRELWDYVTAR